MTRLATIVGLTLLVLAWHPGTSEPTHALAVGDPVVLAAGDVASCSSTGDEATADILDAQAPETVLVLGDLAYESGTPTEFDDCYDPTWGRHKAVTKPSPGNHEYVTAGAAGYYGYFGVVAGNPLEGWYSFDLGDWHIVSLNSNCSSIGGCNAGSDQENWLRADLAASDAVCTLAYFHHPRFSSAQHGDHAIMQPIWQALYDYDADLVLSGHDHSYERFGPQTPAGTSDPVFGIREFVVGTGGKSHYAFGAPKPNSEVRHTGTFGVLELSLHATTYDWEFLPETGQTFTDTGSDSCHGFDDDADTVDDSVDNCLGTANSGQENNDANFIEQGPVYMVDDATLARSDGLGDACDGDDDNDALADETESAAPPCASASAPTAPLLLDSDGDRVADGAECAMGSDPANFASKPQSSFPFAEDPDNDRLATAFENVIGTDSNDIDSDDDALQDGWEFKGYASDPLVIDSDLDGTRDSCEAASLNTDTVVNPGDQALLAAEVARMVPQSAKIANMDLNRDGSLNPGDQAFQASRVGPGKCP